VVSGQKAEERKVVCMSLVDDLVAAVESSAGDAGRKQVVVGFLRAAGPAVERLGAEAFQRVMQSAAAGESVTALVGHMTQGEVVGMLGQVEAQMARAAEGHAAELAARAAALAALQQVALSVVARLLLGL
jgi:hypothetical protein